MPEAKRWPACLASSTLSSMAARAGMRSMWSNWKCAQAQGDENLGIELGVGAGQQGAELVVELNLPAQHAQDQRRGQVAVGSGERVDGFAAQQIVGVGMAALDGHQNLEGGLARWGDLGHGPQPSHALAGSAIPRRNSAAARRFLPSS